MVFEFILFIKCHSLCALWLEMGAKMKEDDSGWARELNDARVANISINKVVMAR